MSQDHLELLFGAIRAHGGTSNNPNIKQFQTIYKRLLMRNEAYNKLIILFVSNDIFDIRLFMYIFLYKLVIH